MSGPRTLRRVGSWLAGAVALLLVINVGDRLMTFDAAARDRQRPFEVSADLGKPALARTFTVTVLDVRGAGIVGKSSGTLNHTTTGVWVLVKIRATAAEVPTAIAYAAVRDRRGRVFTASDRLDQSIDGGRTLQPGVHLEGELVFEVPRDAATNLTLLLAEEAGDRRMDSQVTVELPRYGDATVDGWANDKSTVVPAPAMVVA